MRPLSPTRIVLYLLGLTSLVAFVCPPAFAREPKFNYNKRILMISEMGMSSPPVFAVAREITSGLQASPHRDVDFYFESLDTNLFSDAAMQEQAKNWLLRKYADRKPDVIIAAGPTPLRFLATEPEFFPDVPVVFVGSFFDPNAPLLPARFTGAWLRFDPKRVLETAVALQPGTKNVYVVGGIGPLDRLVEQLFHAELRDFETRYRITYLTDLSMSALLERLRHLPEHSVVLFALLFEDAEGRRFMPETQALPLVVGAANAPVFHLGDVEMYSGAVGGYVTSFAEQGKVATADVIKILDGASPSQIPIVNGTNQYIFDWRAILKWNLNQRAIPDGSIILYREPTMWQRYKPQLIAIGLVILLLSTLSTYLAFETQRRRRAEAETALSLSFEQLISELSAHFIDLPADKIDEGVSRALDRLVEALRIDRITVFVFTQNNGKLVTVYVSQAEANTKPKSLSDAECPWYLARIANRESVVVNRLSELADEAGSLRQMYEGQGVRSAVAVPLESENLVLGCLSFEQTTHENTWTPRLVGQFETLGHVISNALVRKEADQQRQKLSGMLINAEEAERSRLARELHDDFSQRLAVLAVDLERIPRKNPLIPPEAKEQLEQLHELATGVGTDLHSLSHRLHSSTLDSLGLVDAIELLCQEFEQQNEIDARFAHQNVPEQLPPDIALCLFRIAQECLTNVKKHSRATYVDVQLKKAESTLTLSIHDNGSGFDVTDATKRGGLGLRSMQERVRLIHGTVELRSAKGEGTSICVEVSLVSRGEEGRESPVIALDRLIGE